MILAGKRAGFRLGAKDVFLNITGGISVDDPTIDLAVVAAILSSNEDIPVEGFVLQEKWACLGNPSKPSRPTHPGSRKIRLLDHFCIQIQ
jgi:hypothetical protein